ncbi:unnamed protein product [Rangifer tarandus platyrhynchus]|uniref:Uncharacterized protein n=1 Tax=Rangifer tarandus platyrhynchus TaxID=3082113 RepID=A0ABN8YEJ6_RANTA|nr:unnamed protein product [Rangifer tarandus platyrhynchus]
MRGFLRRGQWGLAGRGSPGSGCGFQSRRGAQAWTWAEPEGSGRDRVGGMGLQGRPPSSRSPPSQHAPTRRYLPIGGLEDRRPPQRPLHSRPDPAPAQARSSFPPCGLVPPALPGLGAQAPPWTRGAGGDVLRPWHLGLQPSPPARPDPP